MVACGCKCTYPGYDPPFSSVSTKNWLSKTPGVESKGDPGMVGSILSAAAIVCLGRMYDSRLGDANVAYDVSKATTASGPNPASSKRSSIVSTLSAGYLVSHPAIQKIRMAYGMVQGLSDPVQGEWPWDGQAGTQVLAHQDSYSHQRQRQTEC